jgi:hypothetical protein
MKLVPNAFDVRIRKKFKEVLRVSEKDLESHLKQIPEEPEAAYQWVSLEHLGEEPSPGTSTKEGSQADGRKHP